MPIYIYRAVTKNGQIVSNKVEALNKMLLLKKLKNNGLQPIEVKPPIYAKSNKRIKKQKRNMETSNSVLKQMRTKEIQKSLESKKSRMTTNFKQRLLANTKITKRDIIIFTQNFYLLKKANFNNIHALSTILETTENPSLKAILEDILIGVETGENMYITMEYYTGVFPPIYVNMVKVGELSRISYNSIRTSNKVHGRYNCNEQKIKINIST